MQPYYKIPASELGKDAKIPLQVLDSQESAFRSLAEDMIHVIRACAKEDKDAVLICPVGPVGQYPFFLRMVNEERLSLRRCWFINMDEYLDDDDRYIPKDHRLSFRGFMDREVYAKIEPSLLMPPEQRIFPDPERLEAIPALLEKLGGVDLAIGGIGINGHLAFNEAREDLTPQAFSALSTRVENISRETLTANAIGDLGGALEAMPKRCVTLGMKEILEARLVRLGVFRDWHRAVVRRAAYGEVSAAFPATLLQKHPDACVYVSDNAAKIPF